MFMAFQEHITKIYYSQQQPSKERLYGTHCIDRGRHFDDSTNGATNVEIKVYTIEDDKQSGETMERARKCYSKGGGLKV